MTHFAPVARRLSALVFLLLSAVPAAAEEPIRWGADQEGGQPYIFLNEKGELVGFEVDIANALSKEMNRKIEFTQTDFKNIVAALLKGDFDFAMNGLEVTPERQEQVRFGKPYYVYRQQLVVRKDEERIKTLRDCKTLRGVVGTMEATAAERILRKEGIETKTYDGPTEAYQDLSFGRLDAVFLDYPMAVSYARDDKTLKFTGQPTAKGYYAMAFRPGDKQLADDVDAAMERLKQNGTLREIYRKWGLWNEAQEELMPGWLYEEDALTGGDGGLGGEGRTHYTPSFYLPMLGQAALWTIGLTVCSFTLAVLLGLPLALIRLYVPWPLNQVATVYIEFFRGIPALFVLFFLYFGLPMIGQYYDLPLSLSLPAFWAATLCLGLNYAAYEAEIYRAGIQAIPAGQWEAAASLGMPPSLTFRRIILPQALRSILPPMTGDLVALFKETSIASTIGFVELLKQYMILSKSSLQVVEIGLATALLYLLMSIPLGYLSRRLEQRWGRHTA